MPIVWAVLIALVLLAPEGLSAGPLTTYDWEPRYLGNAKLYGFLFDDQGIAFKNGKIARDCPDPGRGLIMRATEDGGFGFGQLFPDANRKRAPVWIGVRMDPTKLDSPGARAAVELDSPFVPIGGSFDNFLILDVERLGDGTLRVSTFARENGGTVTAVGTPQVLPGATPGISATISYENGTVDVEAGPCDGPLATIVAAQPLAFGGNAGLGVGIAGATQKGDAVGFNVAVSGDIHDAATQDVLDDLQAALDLEVAALTDLDMGNNQAARDKIEQARQRIEDQGPQVPGSDPPVFEPDLLEKAGALPESKARDKALKELRKAAERDAKARAKIDEGGAKDLEEARKQLDKAREGKVKAKRILETGVVAEGKGAL
jgi:hypothetical protein